MTRDAAFLRSVVEAPADDAPRLAYADWLEDHGETCSGCKGTGRIRKTGEAERRFRCPDCNGTGRVSRADRAEFIRVQCALESLRWCENPEALRGPLGYWDNGEINRHDAFRRRERELLFGPTAGAWKWHGFPPPYVSGGMEKGPTTHSFGARMNVWRRGFVAEVQFTLEDWCGRECGCTQVGRESLTSGRASPRKNCPACSGLGRVGALGPQLVAASPLERVTFSDDDAVTPTETGRRWFWFVNTFHGGGNPASYPSRADALAALSAAALAWARRAAGLPELTKKEARRADA